MKWKRESAGEYTAREAGHVYDISREEKEDGSTVWICRIDWVPFDAGATLREAKRWCQACADNLPTEDES